ncbi:MAG: AI-2E family transporter [Dehalococcoidia bacterium]
MIRIELTFRNLLLFFALLLLFWVTYLARSTVVLLGMAVMLMATLHPLVKLAERRGLPHSWAVTVTMLSLVLVPLLVLALLSPLVISEVQGFARSFPTLQAHLDTLLQHLGIAGRVNEAISKTNPQDRIAGLAVVSAQQTVSVVVAIFEVIVIGGYLLSDSRRLQLVLHDFVPQRAERHIEPLLEGMERVVGGYIRGQLLTSAMFGVFAFVLCLVLGVPNPLLLGIVAAIGDVIPLFGVPAAMLVTILVAFTHSVWQPAAVLVGYIIYGQLESHLIVPRIYSRTVNLSPLMVIIATIMGGALDGVIGILIGIPIVGVLKVLFDYVIAERRRGQASATATMLSESTDEIGEQHTEHEYGQQPEAPGEEPPEEGIPAPTLSPFEPVPEPEPAGVRMVSGARYLTSAHVRARRSEPPVTTASLRGRRRR